MSDAPQHLKRGSRPFGLKAAIVAVVCLLVAASTALVVSRVRPGTASAASPKRVALSVVTTTPAANTSGVALDADISVQVTAPLAADSPLPTIKPAVAGTWVRSAPTTLLFESTQSFPPDSSMTLTVPGGAAGIEGTRGQHLARPLQVGFTTAPMSTLRLQQLLAELDYLPVSFTPSNPAPVPANQMAVAQLGTFSWRWNTLPSSFMALWSPGQLSVMTTGAVMAFEDQHNLPTDGIAGPQVWAALLQAAATGQTNSYGHYDFVIVSTSLPEHVDVWRDGQIVYSTLANTGIEAAPTEEGTWPVYARYTSTTMSGTNPDGSHYDDPGVPWVSYFHGGDALHGFIRASYGYPQSLGCVEMPPANAEVVFPYTPLGTLVTVA
jgi:hypothetical protein